jgi:hypothetical protein
LGTVSGPEVSLQELRRRVAELPEEAGDGPAGDVERVWAAAAGELAPEETAEVVDLLTSSPELLEAWRLAVAMQRQMEPETAGRTVRPLPFRRRVTWGWVTGLAVAAALVMAVGLPLLRENVPVAGERFRGAGESAGESRLEDGAALSRTAFLLLWKPAGAGAVYDVTVTDEAVAPLVEARALHEASYRVPVAALAPMPDGATILWQVTVHTPDGGVARSTTHRQRVAP